MAVRLPTAARGQPWVHTHPSAIRQEEEECSWQDRNGGVNLIDIHASAAETGVCVATKDESGGACMHRSLLALAEEEVESGRRQRPAITLAVFIASKGERPPSVFRAWLGVSCRRWCEGAAPCPHWSGWVGATSGGCSRHPPCCPLSHPPQSVAPAAGATVHMDVLRPLPVGGRLRASRWCSGMSIAMAALLLGAWSARIPPQPKSGPLHC
jgi:hypothetical protein